MLVVSDLEDMFVPLLDGFLVKLSESEAVIDRYVSFGYIRKICHFLFTSLKKKTFG